MATSYVGISSADGSTLNLNDGSAITITYPNLDGTSTKTDSLPISGLTLSPYGSKNFTYYIYSKESPSRILVDLNYNITQGTNTVIVASYSSKLGNGVNYNNFKVYQAPELTEAAKKGISIKPGESLPDPSTVIANYNTVKKGAMKIEWQTTDTKTPGDKTAHLNVIYNGSGSWGMRGEGGATYTRTLDVPLSVYSAKEPKDKVPVPKAVQGKLTDEYKEQIKKNVEAVNPGATVTVDDQGNADVTSDGTTTKIPSDKTVKDVDKSALDAAIKDGDSTKSSTDYINADSSKKSAYEQALVDGQKLLDSDSATQEEIDAQVAKIKAAKDALDGKATDKTDLDAAIKKAEAKKGEDDYNNASNDAKSKLDLAIQKAKDVLNDDGATQEEVNKAISELNDAISGLSDSQAKNIQEPSKTPVPEAYQGNLNDEYKGKVTDAVKKANENADLVVPDGEGNVKVTFKDGSTASLTKDQTTKDVDKSALQTEINGYEATKQTPQYYNASSEKKKNYDDAKTNGDTINADKTASQDLVDTTTTAIINAKKALDGKATDKQKLQDLYARGNSTKESQVYTNGSTNGKSALDQALTDAKAVLDNQNATQEQVDTAAKQLQDAQDLLSKSQAFNANDPEKVSVPKAYYQKKLTRNLKSKVEAEIKNANPDMVATVTVDDPGDASVVFKDGSKKFYDKTVTTKEVDTSELQALIDEQETIHNSGKYLNASEGTQSNYDNKLGDGMDGLANPALTQDQADTLANAIKIAKQMLDGYETDKTTLKSLIDEAPNYKQTEPYTTASDKARAAYDQAITQGTTLYGTSGSTQTEVNNMVKIIEDAKRALQDSSDAAAAKVNSSVKKTPVGDKDNLNGSEKDKVKAAVKEVNTSSDISDVTVNDDGSVDVKFSDGSRAKIDSKFTIKDTDKTALKSALDAEDYVKTEQTVNYNGQDIKIYESATQAARDEYDAAIEAGKSVYGNEKASQDEIDAVTKRINDAVKGLASSATDAQVNFNYGFGLTPVIDLDNVSETEKGIIKSKIAEGNKGDDGQTLVDVANTTIDAQGNAEVAMKDGSKVKVDKKFTVRAVDKSVLQKDIEHAGELQGNTEQYNRATTAAKTAFQAALTKANTANDNPTSQEDVDKAASELEQAMSDLIKSIKAASSKVKDPATKTPVGRGRDLYTKEDDNEKGKIEAAVKEANSDATVSVDNEGNATVSLADGTIVVIDKSKTTKDTNKDALRDALQTANNEKTTGDTYKNASKASQTAFDTAITNAQAVFDSEKSSQKEIDDAAKSLQTSFQKMLTEVEGAASKLNKDVEKTPVGDKTSVTPEESSSIHDEVLAKNPETIVTVNTDGSATVQFGEDGPKAVISNDYTTTSVDKSQLKAKYNEASEIKDTDQVNNASTDAKTKFKEAYNHAKEILDKATATAAEVTDAKTKLDEAMSNLANSLASQMKNPEQVAVPKSIQSNITEESGYVAKIQTAIKTANEGKIAENGVTVNTDGSATVTFTDGSIAKLTSSQTVKDVDKSALNTAVNDADKVKATAKYYNADSALQDAYNEQIKNGQDMLARDSDSQEEIDEQVDKINKAKDALNGVETDKEQLRTLYGTVPSVKQGDDYAKASAKAKTDLEAATNKAKAILDNDSASQKDTDAAYAELDKAIKALANSQAGSLDLANITPVEVPKSAQANLSDDYKSQIKAAVKKADDNVDLVKVDNEGNATVTMKDGSTISVDKSKTVTDVDKSALRPLVEEADTIKASAKYYNADSDLQTAYDQVINRGQEILTSDSATKEDVAQAVSDITKAKAALNGEETNKEGLRATYANATELKDGDSYKLGTAAAKEAFDKAYSDADNILKKDNATQKEVNDANDALQKAMAGFGDSEASKIAMPDKTVVPSYYQDNLEDSTNPYAQKIIDAIKAKNPKATDITFSGDEAVVKFEDGSQIGVKKINLISNVSFDALKPLVDEANDVMESVKFKNADKPLQDAYKTAVNEGSQALGDTKLDQTEVDNLVTEITNAKTALNGVEVDKSGLVDAITKAEQAKTTDKYTYETDANKQAFDKVLADAKAVNAKTDASQTEVNTAKDALLGAIDKLAGEKPVEKADKSGLVDAITKAEQAKTTDKYTYETDANKQAFDKILADAKAVNTKSDASQTEVDTAKDALLSAIDKLAGVKPAPTPAPTPSPVVPTTPSKPSVDKSGLSDLVDKAPDTRKGNDYTGANESAQKVYDDAIKEGQTVLDNSNASQNDINEAKTAIETALTNLTNNRKPVEVKVAPKPEVKVTPTNLPKPAKTIKAPKPVAIPNKKLPQTGVKDASLLGFVGIAIAGLITLFSFNKKHEK
ncbi:LPXTG cell wall anchor domain-containing protein [Lactobacillus psittaci]|uniref:Surface anchor protein n=1 Tax=Lactobacillus psittaci DSM 15354 TaxID=1122152 RepID=A0A0R1S1L8_9LACO|nr:LPXTG cell wall anchor domain-containing protein [Lactobacillus psittaci]KRL62553.1 surface anchor protein [Lactobacillus psittaci DSM 15354]